jgi:hypothetical protein
MLAGGEHGIEDITGRKLDDTYMFEFDTADVRELKPPVLLSPTDLSEVAVQPEFRWAPVEGADNYELQVSKSHTFGVLVWPTQDDHRIYDTSVTPDIAYEQEAYYARIRSADAEGHRSAFGKPVRFFYDGPAIIPSQTVPTTPADPADPTEPATPEVPAAPEETDDSQIRAIQEQLQKLLEAAQGLKIVAVLPKDGSVNVRMTGLGAIVIELSDEVDDRFVTPDYFYIVEERN